MTMVAAGIIGGVSALGSIVGGIFGSSAAKRRQREAAREKKRLQAKLTSLENSRQAIINPYSGTKDLSSLAVDLSSQMSNPFASLGVATQAAEIQMEQTDIALANTLDTIRATGSGAGGATALAQAALQSKKGVSANIEQQESANEKLRAQGEQQLQSMKTAEQQRIQGIQIGEGQRTQSADAQGKSFVFNAKDRREAGQLDRVSAQLSGAQGREAQAASDRTAAVTGAIGGVTSAVGSMATAYSAYKTP